AAGSASDHRSTPVEVATGAGAASNHSARNLERLSDTGSDQRLPIRRPALARSQNTIHDRRRKRSDSVPGRRVGTTLPQIGNRHLAVRTGKLLHQTNRGLAHRASSDENLNFALCHHHHLQIRRYNFQSTGKSSCSALLATIQTLLPFTGLAVSRSEVIARCWD